MYTRLHVGFSICKDTNDVIWNQRLFINDIVKKENVVAQILPQLIDIFMFQFNIYKKKKHEKKTRKSPSWVCKNGKEKEEANDEIVSRV